jgi:short-chain fatty acids transporter
MSTITKTNSGFFYRTKNAFADWSVRWVPDSMVFVLLLTVLVFFMGWGLTPHGPAQLIDDWVKGFWKLLTFAMQMSILIVTGFAIAESKYVKRGLVKIISIPKTRVQTVLFFAFTIGVVGYVHWGIGMMAGIVMGREIALKKKGLGIHYPFIAAIVYAMCACSNGPSQAAPLMLSTPGHFMEKAVGVMPPSVTVFEPHLLAIVATLFFTIPFLLICIMPRKEDAVEIDRETAAFLSESEKKDKVIPSTPAERWDNSTILPLLVGFAGLFWVIKNFYTKGFAGAYDLNTLNFTFLVLALLLHGTPKSFVSSVQRGTANVYGVIIQFPLYAGIFGIISNSGLTEIFTHWFMAISTTDNFPWVVFLYSGLLDFFVPSGGSKFIIEAPYILPAAQKLGANLPLTIDAYTAGTLWINLIQPFWALPILAAFRIRFQDILRFTFIILIWVFMVVTVGLLILPKIY